MGKSLLLAISFLTWIAVTDEMIPAQATATESAGDMGSQQVKMPRTWLSAKDVLTVANRQTGFQYAVLLPHFETPVGPFVVDGLVGLREVVAKVKEATQTELRWVGEVAVFDPRVDRSLLETVCSSTGSDPDPRTRVAQLSLLKHSETIEMLSQLVGSGDGSVQFHALAALVRLEGDFIRNTWPGRLSIFEVLAQELDRDALFYALEEGGPPGGQIWKMAAEILGRAREPSLTRGVWWNIWVNRPSTIRMALWCMGRCGDPSGLGPLRERIGSFATNEVEDLYLAAIVLGELDAISLLAEEIRSESVDRRRAAALGLGLCKSRGEAAQTLEQGLTDRDPAVQFLACRSLGRLGIKERLLRLLSRETPLQLWIAALDALAESGEGPDLERLLDSEPVRLAKVAEVLGRSGGEKARQALAGMLEQDDRWVRAAAAEALAKLGTSETIDRVARLAQDQTENPDVRVAALIGLGRSLSPEAAGPLFHVAGNPSEHYRLRHYAVLGLIRLAEGSGQKWLEQLVDPGMPPFLPFAVRHVRFETPQETAAALVPLLTHGDRDSACAAAGNLSDLGYGPGVRELLEGADIFDNHTRMMHAWGAIRAEGPDVTAALTKAAQSRRRLIRQGAALSLGNRHEPEAVDTLIKLASDSEAGVRAAAAQSLGLSADPLAVPVLIKMSENDSSQVVQTEALRALHSRDFSDDQKVRETIARWRGHSTVPSLREQKGNTFVLRGRAEAYEENLATNLTYETTLCYDSYTNRVIMWGSHGRRYDSPQTGETWFFDVQNQSWQRLNDSGQLPNGSCCNRQMVFDQANNLAILAKSGRGAARGGHGWLNGLRGNLSYSVPWVLDVRENEWYPMRPVEDYGNLGMVGGSYDRYQGLSVWWKGGIVAYDAYSNTWLQEEPPDPKPAYPVNSSAVFDPVSGSLIVVGTTSTWSYDLIRNQWKDLLPSGDSAPGGAPVVYDSANDVMLAFKEAGQDPMGVWVYHLRENRWERLPPASPAPRYGTMFDATYDPVDNVVIISGNESMSWSGALTARETWTYRYRPSERKPEREDLGLKVVVARDGSATLTWNAASEKSSTGFTVLRKVADDPLQGDWEPLAHVGKDETVFIDSEVPGRQVVFYSLADQEGDPSVLRPSSAVRTAPPALRWTAAVAVAGGVRAIWQSSPAEDVVGYHVYRARADLQWPWHDLFEPAQLEGNFERITPSPIPATEFLDKDALIDEGGSELYWPKTFAYVIKAVNRWGVEGGPSPVALALVDPPAAVRVIPWLDGRRLVIWTPPRAGDAVRGYHVMRMDDWHRDYAFRWQAAPVVSTVFCDDETFPRTDRRRYFVSGVDVQGAVGIPSSGAWSHGLP